MSTAQLVPTQLAIIGIDAYFDSYSSLAAFERSIYEGKKHQQEVSTNSNRVLSSVAIAHKFDAVIDRALQDAAVERSAKMAVVIVKKASDKLPQICSGLTTKEADSVVEALSTAQKLLDSDAADTVVIGCLAHDSAVVIGAFVIQKSSHLSNKKTVYAISDTLNVATAKESNRNITYIEWLNLNPTEETVIDERILPYLHSQATASCGISTFTNSHYQGLAAEITSLIKTIFCIYYRYIPPISSWQKPDNVEHWQQSPFYITTKAKPWFAESEIEQRVAAINSPTHSDRYILLTEANLVQQRDHTYLKQTPYYLFPLAAEDVQGLLQQLNNLQQTIQNQELTQAANQTFSQYQTHSKAAYAIAIVGRNQPEILKECDRAITGIVKAVETGKDWQTPVGSYFTPNPQGQKGKVAYVYPGAYNAHLGLGKDLFRLFPNLIDDPVIQSTCNRVASLDKLLYPRSCHRLSTRELEAKERKLMSDPLAMLESETGFAGLITTILRSYFKVQPQASFGYSLGEISMMYAQGVWSDLNQSSNVLHTSPLFKNRLTGTKDAVREYWQLPPQQPAELWRTYVVMGDSKLIQERIKAEKRVYLTQINTPQEVIIAGDPQSCTRVIESLGCDAFRAPFNHVIHCQAIASEYNELMKLNTLPLANVPNIPFYSAAGYGQMEFDSQAIAHSLTQTLIQQVDFPRLVNRVYQDEFRIFIEVGAGSNCSRWIKEILKTQDHATVSLHRRGTNDFTSLIKAIAKLVTHRVKLDLSLLYENAVSQTIALDRQINQPNLAKNSSPLLSFNRSAILNRNNSFVTHQLSIFSNPNYQKLAKKNIKFPVPKTSTTSSHPSQPRAKHRFNQTIKPRTAFKTSNKNQIQQNNLQTSRLHAKFINQEQKHCVDIHDNLNSQLKLLQKIMNS